MFHQTVSKMPLLVLTLALFVSGFSYSMMTNDSLFKNKIIPEQIEEEVKEALSYFPELAETHIEFRFKKKIKKSFMQAQPKFADIFKGKKNRSYFIMISEKMSIEGEEFTVDEIPSEVLTGWIGHELGHIMDYQDRSTINLMGFGLRYLFSSNHIKEAERAADTYAVQHGMSNYILATKNFILDHASLSEKYKSRIKKLYLSPEEIMVLVADLDDPKKI